MGWIFRKQLAEERRRREAWAEALRWAARQVRSEHPGHPFARLIAKGLDGCADDFKLGGVRPILPYIRTVM